MTGKLLTVLLAATLAFATVGIAGCNSDNGPMEKAGQKIDKMTGNEGPAQKAGEKIDQAGQKAKDAIDDATSNNGD